MTFRRSRIRSRESAIAKIPRAGRFAAGSCRLPTAVAVCVAGLVLATPAGGRSRFGSPPRPSDRLRSSSLGSRCARICRFYERTDRVAGSKQAARRSIRFEWRRSRQHGRHRVSRCATPRGTNGTVRSDSRTLVGGRFAWPTTGRATVMRPALCRGSRSTSVRRCRLPRRRDSERSVAPDVRLHPLRMPRRKASVTSSEQRSETRSCGRFRSCRRERRGLRPMLRSSTASSARKSKSCSG